MHLIPTHSLLAPSPVPPQPMKRGPKTVPMDTCQSDGYCYEDGIRDDARQLEDDDVEAPSDESDDSDGNSSSPNNSGGSSDGTNPGTDSEDDTSVPPAGSTGDGRTTLPSTTPVARQIADTPAPAPTHEKRLSARIASAT